MGLWDIFKKQDLSDTFTSGLHQKLDLLFPNYPEDKICQIACISGLMARVAYIDFEIHPHEKEHMIDSLKRSHLLSDEEVEKITELALKEIKSLAGIENYKYARPLAESYNKNQRFTLLISLFQLAASDKEVLEIEVEELRLICKGLLLESKHFVTAKLQVAEYLKSLKK